MSIVDEMEDEDLKAEIVALDLTVPDPQSVIDPQIGDFHPELYRKLAAMEAYTYQASEQPAEATGSTNAGFDQYSPYWQTYNASLMAYVSHEPVPKQKLKDFLIGFYCFVSVHNGRGMGDAELIPRSDAKRIFNFGGYYEDTVSTWPLNRFDDFVPADPMALPEPTEEAAPTLTGEPEVAGGLWDKDVDEIAALIAEFADVVSDAGMSAAFSNPSPPQGSLSPTEMWDLVFEELNWLWYIDTFGSTVKVPERPEDLSSGEDSES